MQSDIAFFTLWFLFFQTMMLPVLEVIQEKSEEKIILVFFFGSWICAEYLIARGLFCHFFMGAFGLKEWIILAIGITLLSAGLLFKRLLDDASEKINKLLST